MRRTAALVLIAALTCAAGTPAKESTRPASSKPTSKPTPKPAPPAASKPSLEFPANEAGRHAQAWFEAFNEGEAAMKKFLERHVAAGALQRRSVADRLEVYRDMREERGKVTPLEIEEFTASRVKAIARGERGGRFAITFLCDEEAPHGFLGLQVEDLPPEEGTPEGLDDAEFSATPPMSEAHVAEALRAYVDRTIESWPIRS